MKIEPVKAVDQTATRRGAVMTRMTQRDRLRRSEDGNAGESAVRERKRKAKVGTNKPMGWIRNQRESQRGDAIKMAASTSETGADPPAERRKTRKRARKNQRRRQ